MRSSSSGTAVKSNRRRLYLEDCTTKGSYLRDVIKHLLLLTLVIFPLCYSTFSSSLSSSSVPPSLPTKNGWNKQTDRLIRKAGLFILQACNWCTETFAVNCILDLPLCFYFFASDSPLLPLSYRWFSVWHCRSHGWDAMLSYFTQSRVWKVQMEHWHIPFSRANKTHCQCYTLLWKSFSFFINCDIRPKLFQLLA